MAGLRRRKALLGGLALPASAALGACGVSGGQSGTGGGQGAAKAPVTVRIMDRKPADLTILEYTQISQAHMAARPNVTVTRLDPGADDRDAKFMAMFAAGDAPDVLWMDSTNAGVFREQKMLRAVDAYIKRDKYDLDDFFPAIQSIYQYKGQSFGVLHTVSPWLLVYNKTLFDKKNVKPPSDNWTWDDLKDAMLRLTAGEGGDATYGGVFSRTWATQTFVYQNNGKVADDLYTPTKFMLDSKESLEGIEFLVDLYVRRNAAVEDAAKTGGVTTSQLWMQGRLGLNFTSIWSHKQWARDLQFEWDQQVPQKNKARATVVSSSAYIVNQQSKVPDDAWDLVKTLNSKESQALLSQTGTLMLGRRSVANSDAFLKAVPKPANMKAFVQITEYSKPPHLVHATGKDFTALWNTVMAPVWKGEQSVTAAMTDMARQANAMFQQAAK